MPYHAKPMTSDRPKTTSTIRLSIGKGFSTQILVRLIRLSLAIATDDKSRAKN
jgi:hypothetical protein